METPNQQPSTSELQSQLRDQQHQIRALAQALSSARQPIPSRFNRIRRLGLGGTLALCLALMLGTVALAAIPGAGGVITGCYRPETGRLRVIDAQAGKRCERGENQVTWNQVGPQGVPGTPGLKGDTGAPGAQGLPGIPGAQGLQGLPGAIGPQGDTGPQGLQGLPGAQGPAGGPGPKGDQGLPGPKGDTGPQGPQGVPGAGISGYEVAYAESAFDSSSHKALTVDCPAGKTVLGGGGEAFASLGDPNRNSAPIVVRNNEPYFNGWGIIADEFAPYEQNWLLRVFAICANVG
jgi:hypothetical protein